MTIGQRLSALLRKAKEIFWEVCEFVREEKKTVITLVLIFFVLYCNKPPERYTATANLNCRASPGMDGAVIGKVFKEQWVFCSGYKGEWCKAVCDGKVGYVHKKYLLETPEEKKP